ncbi:MAG: c-type cytochrome [Inquilinus sp.]|nr:c-type cytochrome [Inquilinus sp.]
MNEYRLPLSALGLFVAIAALPAPALSDEGHDHAPGAEQEMLEQMRRTHAGHQHDHDFEAMEAVSAEDMQRVMTLMMDIGLALPPMDSERGRETFLAKGCVACHSVNGIGGAVGPSLDAAEMPAPMNAFEFAARMLRGAAAMAQMQDDLLGAAVELNGQELADLIAFAHDEAEQRELTTDQIPDRYRDLILQ